MVVSQEGESSCKCMLWGIDLYFVFWLDFGRNCYHSVVFFSHIIVNWTVVIVW